LTEILKPSEHPKLDLMKDLWFSGLRATEIAQYLNDEGLPPVKVTALAKFGQRNWNSQLKVVVADRDLDELQTLISDIEDSGMRVEKITQTKRSGFGWEKIDGVNTQVPRETTAQTLQIRPDDSTTFERATLPAITINSKPATSRSKPANLSLGVAIPDMQIGYHRGPRGELTTTHDEAAINVMHQILVYLEEIHGVDLLVNLGDNLDLPMFSSHRTAPGYLGTYQLAIDRAGTEAAVQREICPDSKNVWLEGNHEARQTNAVVDKLPGLAGITRSNDTEPVLSIPYLCRFDDSRTEFVEGYPEGEFWANKRTRFVHGSLYSSNKGGTASKYIASKVNTICGHIHSKELLYATQKTPEGGYEFFCGSPGSLCKNDGSVPSSKTGITSSGAQNSKPKTEDWNQGIYIVWYDDDVWADIETVKIEDGYALFRGVEFHATVTPNGDPI